MVSEQGNSANHEPRTTNHETTKPNAEPCLDLGDAVQSKDHLLEAQLDFFERLQQRRPTSQSG
jgi:hypothetical protein